MYADTVTRSIQACLEETKRRRKIQQEFNKENGITPETIKKSIHDVLASVYETDYLTISTVVENIEEYISEKDIPFMIKKLTRQMKEAAKDLKFEEAAKIRDRIKELSGVETEIALWKQRQE
jgi:excinuclease ABC subunit B